MRPNYIKLLSLVTMKKLITSTLLTLFCTVFLFAQDYEIYNISSETGIYSIVPSNIDNGVTSIPYNFSVHTNDPNGMRIFIEPLSQGNECKDCNVTVGSPLITPGQSNFSTVFYLEGGSGLIDELRVKITGVTVNDIKREFSIPVRIFYGEDYPFLYRFRPVNNDLVPTQCLIGEDKINIAYDYYQGADNKGFKMTALPMTRDELSPFYLFDQGSSNPETGEVKTCSFFIAGGKYVGVDSIQLLIQDYAEEITYGSFTIPTNISFGKVIIDNFSIDDIVNNLSLGDFFEVDFSTKVKQNYSSNYWVYFDPMMGDSVIENCSGNDPEIYSLMEPEGTAAYTVDDSYTYADGFRLQILDNEGVHVLGQFIFSEFSNDFRVIHSPIDMKIEWSSPVDYSLSRIGDNVSCEVSLSSTALMDVYVKMTPYEGNDIIAGVEPAYSDEIELSNLEEVISLSTPVNEIAHVTNLLIEVLDADSDEVLLSYMKKANKRFGSLNTDTKETKTDNGFDFSVFPNPSNGRINLDLRSVSGDAMISVYNTLGQLVSEQNLFINEELISLDINNKGLYKVVVRTDEGIGVQTVVVQ